MPTVRSVFNVPNFLGAYDPNRPIIPGINEPPGAGGVPGAAGSPGALLGLPGIGGSAAAGQRPQVPDPSLTAGNALAGNLANLARLSQLFNRTSAAVGVTPEFTSGESDLISRLQNAPRFLREYPDEARKVGEWGAFQGQSGSPAQETLGYRLTDEERLRRQLLGSNLLSQRAQRANTILPLQQFMQTPNERQLWENFASILRSGADPELAFRRAIDLARQGINQGYQAGYGGGAPRTTPSSAPVGAPAIPTWPTLPSYSPPQAAVPNAGGPGSVYAPPPTNFNEAEDWLNSLGLGLNSPGVSITPTGNTSSFMGDINPGEDFYA
jgi:hypothetical protein